MDMNLESVNTLIRKRKAKQKKLAELGPVITGSLSKIYRKCGKPYCRCADGEGHPANIAEQNSKMYPFCLFKRNLCRPLGR